jgi:hypothetical protein
MGMIALVRENFEDWPSAKIRPHENYPLYGIPDKHPCGSSYMFIQAPLPGHLHVYTQDTTVCITVHCSVITLLIMHVISEEKDSNNLYFCFRWLLVHFKREFSYEDIVCVWEVCSRRLETFRIHRTSINSRVGFPIPVSFADCTVYL